ncbi:MAG: hypothetical protein BWY20_02389 [Spirochaetes bacterium ADurb.Bin215]|nr:MAG: hypothetical protein BWY20_02389 [Spirochaetes bacterium ADurb.Bin215]
MPEITYLPRNYQRKENEQLTGKLSKGFEWVQIAQEQVRQSILDDSMNLWEITPVVVSVLERMKPNARELAAIEQKMISDQKKENRFKIGTVALSAAATIACFFLSGGAATALQLAAKAGAVTVATAGGIVMGVDELANALETERMVYASMYSKENGAFTNEDIVSAKNGTRATAFYFALDIFGTFEAVQAWKMLNRFNGLSSRTQDVLGTLKNGKKVLSAIDQTSDPIKTAEVLNVMKEHGTLSTLEKITDETKLRQALTLVPDNPRATAIFIECGIDAERVAAIENSALARLSTIHTNYAALKYDTSNGDICSLMTDLFMKEGDFSELEMAALIKAQLEGKIDIPSVLMRVQVNNEYVTLYDSRKSLAWATDPYLFAGKLKDNNNFRELCGLERSTDTKLYVDVILFRNDAQKDLVLDTISADRIKFDTKEGLRNLIKRYEGATGETRRILKNQIFSYNKDTSVGTNQIFIPNGNTYTLNESFLDNEYLRYLGVKAPGNDGPSLLVVNGKRLEGNEAQRYRDAFKMVEDTTGCNLRFTGEDFTIQNSGSIGVNEYGILKTDANFDIDAINKAGDARVVRIMIDTAVQNPHFVVIKQGGN